MDVNGQVHTMPGLPPGERARRLGGGEEKNIPAISLPL